MQKSPVTMVGFMSMSTATIYPQKGGNIPCFYEPVFCRAPAIVENATVKTNSSRSFEHFLYDRAEYSCDKGFEIIGNKSLSCTYSGQWSTPPRCLLKPTNISKSPNLSHKINESKSSNLSQEIIRSTSSNLILNYSYAILPTMFILLSLLFVIFVVRYKMKFNKKQKLCTKIENDQVNIMLPQEEQISVSSSDHISPLKRNRTFDAAIFYHFDTDDDFVVDHLLPELEETRDFKLCIHSRNFTPGRDIKDNIEEAIKGSNSVIIVRSQGFVDSMWCKEEFTHCYIENMEDESFNLFVIMMQPAETLVNISPYMKTFFVNKTYLDVNDPELFIKLATHLEDARQQDDDNNDCCKSVSSNDEQTEELISHRDQISSTEKTNA